MVSYKGEWQSLGSLETVKTQPQNQDKEMEELQLFSMFYWLLTQDRVRGHNDFIFMIKPILIKINHALKKNGKKQS